MSFSTPIQTSIHVAFRFRTLVSGVGFGFTQVFVSSEIKASKAHGGGGEGMSKSSPSCTKP